MNGDGLGDLAVTLRGGSLPTDEVLVFPGSRTGIRPHPDAVLQAPSGTFEDAGASGAGDLNGDGFGDLLAPERSLGSPFISILAVFPGSTEGVSQTPAPSSRPSRALMSFHGRPPAPETSMETATATSSGRRRASPAAGPSSGASTYFTEDPSHPRRPACLDRQVSTKCQREQGGWAVGV